MTFVKQSDLVLSVNINKMSAGTDVQRYPDSTDADVAAVLVRRKTIEVPQQLEIRGSDNLMVAPGPGNVITSQNNGVSKYHVTTDQSNLPDPTRPGFFLNTKVKHLVGNVGGPTETDQFWNVQREQPKVVGRVFPRRGWATCPIGDEDRNFLPLSRSTSSESCAIPR